MTRHPQTIAILLTLLLALTATACDDPEPSEAPATTEATAEPTPEPTAEPSAELPEYTAEVSDFDGEDYSFRLLADGEAVFSAQYAAEGGREARVDEVFTSTYCGQDVVVVVLQTEVSTGISVGSIYQNLLFSHPDTELVSEYSGGEVRDREDGSAITDNQAELLESLRAGVDDPERCGV